MNSDSNSVYRKPDCPFGHKAINLLRKQGVIYQDHLLQSEAEVEEIKNRYNVKTTPQIFLNGERLGGYSELAAKFGEEKEEEEETSYAPVIAVFSVSALLAIATRFEVMGFMGFSLVLLATLKLMDISAFVKGFKKYDLVTQKVQAYGKVYPFIELLVGLAFLSGVLINIAGILAVLVGSAGGYSVYKAVYIDKKDLNCACIGGGSKAPLGAVSFSENAIMAIMGLWFLLF